MLSASLSSNGKYYIYVKDAAGNISERKEVSVTKIDTTAPTFKTGSISRSSMTAEFEDTQSGIKEMKYFYSTSNVVPTTKDNFTTSTSVSTSCGTTYYGFAYAIDNVGNESEIVSLGQYRRSCSSSSSSSSGSSSSSSSSNKGTTCDWQCQADKNSEEWHSATDERKQELEKENEKLYKDNCPTCTSLDTSTGTRTDTATGEIKGCTAASNSSICKK